MKTIPKNPIPYKPGGKNTRIFHPTLLIYEPNPKQKIQVLLWQRWPSYDFIFGVPDRTNSFFSTEAGFFQYRDTRRKKVVEGFYVDKRELQILIEGFTRIKNYRRK